MDDIAFIRTISATANKGRQEPDGTRRCLILLAERDAARDEELVEGLARWLFKLSMKIDGSYCKWEKQKDMCKDTYRKQARQAIKQAREVKCP